MAPDPAATQSETPHESIVAVFDTKTVALRAHVQLVDADFDDIWIGIVRGENAAGHTTVALDGDVEFALHAVLSERGFSHADVHRFDGILPPGTAVMSLRAAAKIDHAIDIIELTGGHIDHL